METHKYKSNDTGAGAENEKSWNPIAASTGLLDEHVVHGKKRETASVTHFRSTYQLVASSGYREGRETQHGQRTLRLWTFITNPFLLQVVDACAHGPL